MGRKDTLDTKASKAILIKVSYLVNLNEDETDLFDNITGEISNDQKIVINSKLKNIEWVETSSLELTPNHPLTHVKSPKIERKIKKTLIDISSPKIHSSTDCD
jgi:hypothetical protein